MEVLFVLLAVVLYFLIYAIIIKVRSSKRYNMILSTKDEYISKGYYFNNEIINFVDNSFALFVDNVKKCMIYFNVLTNTCINIKFSDLISFELKEDGQSIIQGKTGGAIVGGALFGAVGAVVGAAGSRKMEGTCMSLYFNLYIDNVSNPLVNINIIDKEIKKDSEKYDNYIKISNQLLAIFKYVIYYNNKTK